MYMYVSTFGTWNLRKGKQVICVCASHKSHKLTVIRIATVFMDLKGQCHKNCPSGRHTGSCSWP